MTPKEEAYDVFSTLEKGYGPLIEISIKESGKLPECKNIF